jgi:hypothetical protein
MIERLKTCKLDRFFQAHSELKPLTKIGMMGKMDKIIQAIKNLVAIAERSHAQDEKKL